MFMLIDNVHREGEEGGPCMGGQQPPPLHVHTVHALPTGKESRAVSENSPDCRQEMMRLLLLDYITSCPLQQLTAAPSRRSSRIVVPVQQSPPRPA